MDRSRYRPLYLGALALGVSLLGAGTLLATGSLVDLSGIPAPVALGALALFLTALVAGPVVYRVVD